MAKEITMPRLSETMIDGKILAWYKSPGDRINSGDVIAEVETDKATMEIESPESGILSEILVHENEVSEVGVPIATLDGKVEAPKREEPKVEEKPEPQPEIKAEVEGVAVKSSPMARKIAQENNIDLSNIQGSGPGGRITEQDVMNYIQKKEIKELPRIRQTIARRMTESKQTIPHFYVTYEVNAEKLSKFKEGIEPTYNDIFIKASALALAKNPVFNAHYANDKIELFKNINVGFALALEDGVIVPVVQDCQDKSLNEISQATQEIKERAKANKLKPEEMQSGTFTISNLGMFGVKEFIPIINPPQIGGLAIGAIIRQCIHITLSADHRAVDGVEACKFMQSLKEILENPEQMAEHIE
ncbi:MAG: hypothetical protein A2Y25_05295 [Candidatus Melainabacteria bacterium GWF2_37_15]|nr:MAG: hypothetical protein A2Y25_05295 [Candidatus Melainabacteria bacterium GWF2_37_15]